jgi:ArpU family phage transcriptional regulator
MGQEQMSYIDTKMDRNTRRKVEGLLGSYRSLPAIIKTLEMDLPEKRTKMTVNYEASESQRGNGFHSQTETLALLSLKIDDKKKVLEKLNILYNSFREEQQTIWIQRYVEGKYDDMIYNDLRISERKYYRLKREILYVVAEAFGFL